MNEPRVNVGIRVNIPVVEEHNGSYSRFARITNANLKGRPIKVLLRFLCLGIEKGWFKDKDNKISESEVFKRIIFFGFDNKYITDVFLAATVAEYLLTDRTLKKDENLRKIFEEDKNGSNNS